MSVKRRIKNRDIQRTWSLQGDPSQRRVTRRNTTIPEAVPQPSPLFDTPPYSPKTPPNEGPDLGPRFNFFHKRRASVPASMLAGRPGSTKSALGLGVSSGSLNRTGTNGKGFPNGRSSPQRSRHLSTGSSVHSDEHETSLSTAASSTNFFDFDENSDDIYLVQPEEHVNNMRKEHKKRESLRKESLTAQPFTPLNVETIGGAYIEEDGGAIKGHSRQGSKVSVLSSIAESMKSGSSSKSVPSSIAQIRLTPPDTPNARRDLIAKDEKIARLERELEELKAARWKPPLITDTINRILMGQSYCLEWYKSMDQKRALLDAAIDTYDGNCITTVLLFIRKTLNHQILMMMVKQRPRAINHYCSFLKQLHAWKELTSVYQTLGDYESLGYLKLRECEEIQDPDQRLKQLQDCQTMFKTTPALEKNAHYIEECIKLLKKQKEIKESEEKCNTNKQVPVLFTPLTTTLLYCCRWHCKVKEDHPCSPTALRTMFSISEKQYFQVCLVGLTLCQNWTEIDTLLTTKGVFGFGKKKKSPIGFDRVVRTLGNPKLTRRPPADVLKKYLLEVEDLESRLSLATYAEVYDVGIEALKLMKDRERLRNYINQIPMRRQPEFRGKIRALVDNTQIKWKTH